MTAIEGPWRYGKSPHDGVTEPTLLCTVPVVEWDYPDDGEALVAMPPRECGSEVYVTWSFSVPICDETVHPGQVPTAAVSSSWEAACENGHTLAVSANQYSATDDAEPFDQAVVFGPVPT